MNKENKITEKADEYSPAEIDISVVYGEDENVYRDEPIPKRQGENTEELEEQLDEALDTIDDMVNTISEIIIDIGSSNSDFVCTACLKTAEELYRLIKRYAREEDAASVLEQYTYMTGRSLDE